MKISLGATDCVPSRHHDVVQSRCDLQPGSQEARTKVNLLSRARGEVSDEIVPDHWVAAKDGPKVRVRELVPVFDDTRVAYRAVFHIGASLYA